MGNWQERVRQMVEKESLRAIYIRETSRKLGLQKQQEIEKTKGILRSIGVYEILEKAKAVWQTGKVLTEIDEDNGGVKVILEVQYDGSFSESGSSDYSYVPRILKGIWRDRLVIETSPNGNISVIDLHEFKTPGGWFNSDNRYGSGKNDSDNCARSFVKTDFNDYAKTRREVEESTRKFCESRILSKTLPLDYRKIQRR